MHICTYVLCYSDPNTIETLKSFQHCIEWAANGNFSDDDVDEAKLGVFSQVDTQMICSYTSLTMYACTMCCR